MKVISTATVAILAGSSCTTAFAPAASKASITQRTNSALSMGLPFFAQEEEKEEPAPVEAAAPVAAATITATPAAELKAEAAAEVSPEDLAALPMDEEIEILVQKELSKTKRMSNLRNTNGVEYAPWMGISEAEEVKIRSLVRERTAARRIRQEQERDVSGNLFRDSQAQELSGTGLSYKIIDGAVELQWATKSESGTKGFVVKRRAAKTNDYSVIASHNDWGPLQSKGREGGVYRYLDDTAGLGGWVYRISEEDNGGNEADICQCLVEVESEDEQKGAVIAAAGFAVFAVVAVVAGIALDPMNGYTN